VLAWLDTIDQDSVKLRKPMGEEITVPIAKWSEKDQAIIRAKQSDAQKDKKQSMFHVPTQGRENELVERLRAILEMFKVVLQRGLVENWILATRFDLHLL